MTAQQGESHRQSPVFAVLLRFLDEGTMRLLHLAPATVLLAALGGCVSSEPVAYSEPPVVQSMTFQPQQRSYLDAGPAPARLSGPGNTRDSQTGFAGRSDSFGGGVLPSF
jgi:hypothetical protein